MSGASGYELILKAEEFFGTPYRFGAEVRGADPPLAFDCSEYVEYICRLCGIYIPDGSWKQYGHCKEKGTLITIDEARSLPGALVFRRDSDSQLIVHVAFTDGANNTCESRGKEYGTGRWPWRPGWTDAARIPGVHYK